MTGRSIPRVMIVGAGSGCGKTTVTCGVLGALRRRGVPLSAFKCGPDYIDPMFHRAILDIPSRNLDLFLCGEETVSRLLSQNTPPGHTAVVEGVMGYYDGIGMTDDASSAHLSRALGIPAVLVVSARGKALSLAAEVRGFLDFRPGTVRGVILNNASPHGYPAYREMLEAHCGVKVLGYLPSIPEAALESRHLGLVTAAEVDRLREKMDLLNDAAAETVDLDALLELARSAGPITAPEQKLPRLDRPVRIGLASDNAFCFHYPDSLELLERMGAEIVPFSPLEDPALPGGIQGLLLPGGYPELYGERLSGNRSMRESIRSAVGNGLPTIAECGGFLYLCGSLADSHGRTFPMAGVLPGHGRMTRRLGRFGYHTLTAKADNLLLARGETVNAHEFHYSQADDTGCDLAARKPGGGEWDCVHATETLWAGYPHLHLWGKPSCGWRFLKRCEAVNP